jgi:hypothetical protein
MVLNLSLKNHNYYKKVKMKIPKNIIKDINNKDGFSYSEKTKRYILSLTNNRFIKKDISLNLMENLFKDFKTIEKQLNIKGFFIGFWNNDIYTYIDLNLSFDSLKECLIMAKMFNQIAIFDSVTKTEIKV